MTDTIPAIQDNPDPYLATLVGILETDGRRESADIVRQADVKCEASGYDNWNGGTRIYTISLKVTPADYGKIGKRREEIEKVINSYFKPIYENYSNDWFDVKIVPKIEKFLDWRIGKEHTVSRTVRQNIFDGLRIENVAWQGQLDDVDFLARIFDLKSLPSTDTRFKDAAQDIWQHRINNFDWQEDWVFDDERFNLLEGPAHLFLKFLCETVHPVVRPDREQSLKLVQQYNDQLHRDGWLLVEEEKIAGRPRFVATPSSSSNRSVSRAKSVADALESGWMQKEIERLERSVEHDPSLAIGTAKELVESCCKTILTKRNIPYTNSTDLPDLVKLLTKELKLVPDGIPDEAKGAETIRLLLRNFAAQTKYLAELRSLYGTGHGRDGKHRGLEPRHARLAVGAAVAFIDFVTDTYRHRSNS